MAVVQSRFLLGAILLAFACHASTTDTPAAKPDAAPEAKADASPPKTTKAAPTPSPDAAENTVTLRGIVESIRLQNINKALGHYTYNVEIAVRHDGLAKAGSFDPEQVANPLTVRIEKVFWTELPQPTRDAVAPDGPKAELTPSAWGDFAVGKPVELDVSFTSPSLAHRVE